MSTSSLLVGIDVGGTFTDLIAWDRNSGRINIVKVPTTPENQGAGLVRALEKSRISLIDVGLIVHGTTVATNTLIQRNGAICGLITTKGFRDILELRQGGRPRLYGLKGDFEPLIPRELRIEVDERTTAEGEILKEVEETQILEAGKLLQNAGVEAVIISFLHAYANPANEEKARQVLKTFWPNNYILTSSEILSAPGEFERTSTAVVNAYLQPLIYRYLEGIQKELETYQPANRESQGEKSALNTPFQERLVLMNSYGGILSPLEVKRHPASTIFSGPAGGVIATCYLAQQTGYQNLLSCDMGGTSCDVSVIVEGIPTLIDGKDLDFGIPLRLPMLDITTIGAGGGSIAWIDNMGYLRVGPQSAGAKPGPACYGRRGFKPTVTDANLILGRMNPESPILKSSGIIPDFHLAGEAIRSQVAAPLKIKLEEAAFSILEVVNQNMASLLRLLTIERGYNPGDFVLVAFGGAGPLHAAFLAQEVGIPKVLIPPYSGAFSAYGCMIAEVKQIFEQTLNCPLNAETVQKVFEVFLIHQSHARKKVQEEGFQQDRLKMLCEVEIGHQEQSYGIWIPFLGNGGREGWEHESKKLLILFKETYQKHFTSDALLSEWISEFPLEVKRLRTLITYPRLPSSILDPQSTSPLSQLPLKGTRSVYFQGHFMETPVYERFFMPAGVSLSGPALIEQEDSTTVVPPEVSVKVDRYGNLILTIKPF